MGIREGVAWIVAAIAVAFALFTRCAPNVGQIEITGDRIEARPADTGGTVSGEMLAEMIDRLRAGDP